MWQKKKAYSIETVIAEKLHAVVDLADQSSLMKDYYDLYQILRNEKYEADTLQNAIIRTFENRQAYPIRCRHEIFPRKLCRT